MNKKQDKPDKRLKEQPIDWQAKAIEYEAGWKRAMADLDNYRKQVEQDRMLVIQMTKGHALVSFLEIYDDLKRAVEFVTEEDAKQGLLGVLSKFRKMLEAEGLETLEVAFGDKFDPMTMDAISYEDNELVKDNHVIEMVEAGLKFKDRVIKPAKVRVGK